jgi:CRP-like cAMP-binding protein
MPDTLLDLWRQVTEAFDKQDWDRALRRCVVMLQGAPESFEARMKVGDILLKQGLTEQATGVYKVVAWHFTKAGHPLLGIVAIKMLTAFEESYQDVLDVLANLYSAESDRVASDAVVPALPRLEQIELSEAGRNVDQVISLTGRALSDLAAKLAMDESGLPAYPQNLPFLPLFSDLPEDAFAAVLRDLKLRRLAGDGLVLREGDAGESFFLLARGEVEVVKRVGRENLVLARLSDGAVFGEMALVSAQPRSATVRAVTHLDLLELSRADLDRAAVQLESVGRALKRFTRSRMLNNLMAMSTVFRSLPSEDRHALLDRFISTEVSKGKVIIEEGRSGMGLFVILRGEVEVKKRDGETLVPLALLRVGDVFGEISLVKDLPTTATVLAGSDAELLFLSRKEFDKVVERKPQLKQALAQISDERLRETARLMSQTDFLGDDEFVLL